jgi:murein DD-endopeptidase MepM/ murein hydrolase activator NlpD
MAQELNNKKRKLIHRLQNRYRLVVLNDDTFAERISIKLTPLRVFIIIGFITIVMTTLVISLIAFTPLREYIPGYADVGVKRELIRIVKKSDSLALALEERNAYWQSIANVLKGNVKADSALNKPDKTKAPNTAKLSPSEKEKNLREKIESQDKYSLAYDAEKDKKGISNFFFFTPLKGIVTAAFKASEKHFGIDIVGPENEAIKSALDGTVVSAGWSSETGYTITLQHSNNIISVYKHNSTLLKKAGDYVKAGEPIAIIGNTGEQTTGPHLHFELWYNGVAINPQDYMVF